jgi:hypothetical protein
MISDPTTVIRLKRGQKEKIESAMSDAMAQLEIEDTEAEELRKKASRRRRPGNRLTAAGTRLEAHCHQGLFQQVMHCRRQSLCKVWSWSSCAAKKIVGEKESHVSSRGQQVAGSVVGKPATLVDIAWSQSECNSLRFQSSLLLHVSWSHIGANTVVCSLTCDSIPGTWWAAS